MIPKSAVYKLIQKSDNIIIAEGSSKEIERLFKKDKKNTYMGLSHIYKVGDVFK